MRVLSWNNFSKTVLNLSILKDGQRAFLGEARPSLEQLNEQLRQAEAAGDPWKQGIALNNLGDYFKNQNDQARARELLADCEHLAIEIDLNKRDFATLHGHGNPVLEESWRRTWWDLYVCDGMIAGVHRVTKFLLFDIQADVGLPCEEQQYLTGVSSSLVKRCHSPWLTNPAHPSNPLHGGLLRSRLL